MVWNYDRVKDKIIWKRTVREIELARVAQPIVDKPPTKPPPPIPGGGPDLVVLKDGRWFRGRIVKKDDTTLIIRTFIGQSEMDMTFTIDEVKEYQARRSGREFRRRPRAAIIWRTTITRALPVGTTCVARRDKSARNAAAQSYGESNLRSLDGDLAGHASS